MTDISVETCLTNSKVLSLSLNSETKKYSQPTWQLTHYSELKQMKDAEENLLVQSLCPKVKDLKVSLSFSDSKRHIWF